MKGKKTIVILLAATLVFSLFSLIQVNTVQAQTLLSEDFEDSEANGWTVQTGTWDIVYHDSSYRYDTVDEENIARSYVGDSSWGDYSVEADLEVNSWGDQSSRLTGILGRYTDSSNYYMFVYDSGELKIRKKASGTITDLVTKNYTFNEDTIYTFKAVLNGTSLKLYVNDVEQLSVTDSTFSSGKAGLITCYANAKFDNVLIQTESQSSVLLSEDFEDQNADGWTVQTGTWNIVSHDSSYRYDTVDEENIARSYVGDSSWEDYSIETDLEVNSWGDQNSRLAGILGRYTDSSNYYMFVYDSGELKIREKVSGTITDLVTKNYTFNEDTEYTFKAVLNGTSLKLYVNDAEQLSVTDSTFSSGKAGLITCYANAKFDNVLINSEDPFLLNENFEDGDAAGWEVISGAWNVETDGTKVYDSDEGDDLARSVNGDAGWENYSVSMEVKTTDWGSTTNYAAGILARYTDSINYYMFIYENGELRIKKKVNGTISTIASKSYTFNTSTWYTFKAVLSGTSLKFLVNGNEELSTTDNSFSDGKIGVMTVYGDTQFDNITVQIESAAPTPTPTSTPTSTPSPTPAGTPTPTPGALLLFEDFEDGEADGWTIVSDTWQVILDGTDMVYDTQDEDNLARTVAGESTWDHYSVQADIEVISWGSTDSRTVGIISRYSDTNNYYLFVYEYPGELKIKRKVGGTITTLESKSYTLNTSTEYSFKAVLDGPTLDFYVEENKELTAVDDSFTQGKAGLITCYGNVRFDDVTINSLTPGATPTLGPTATNTPTPTSTPTPDPNATATPTPTAQNDVFGIKMLYQTKQGGDEWFMDMDDPDKDLDRFNPKTSITENPDGSWKTRSDKVRMNVFTVEGYHPERIETYNQALLAEQGYMQDPEDWKNVEITGYVKVNSYTEDDNFCWYARGGRHYDDEPYEGTAYKGDIYYSGRTRFAKEQWHPSGYSFASDYYDKIPDLDDRWIGFKTIMYNFEQNGETVVKMEIWVDENQSKTSWTKINEYIDDGGWGDEAWPQSGSGGPPYADEDQIMTWGGPIVTFRWDSATNTDFKWFSVREIQPPQ